MFYTGSESYIPEKYKDYRNRTITKSLEKFKHQLQGIKACSLKGDDKNKLRKQLLELLIAEG